MTEDWQPIDTAPKDGRWLLLGGGEITYCWDHGRARPPCVVAQWDPPSECWQFAWYDSGYYGEYEHPTKWLAIPC